MLNGIFLITGNQSKYVHKLCSVALKSCQKETDTERGVG